MANPENKPDPKELCIPIYLNQKIVFDLLAVQEDGFSQLSTLRTSISDSETTKNGVGASIEFSELIRLDRAGVYYPQSEAEWYHTVRGS